MPLEVIESFKVDTTINERRMNLIKKYGLTQFDSGVYTIPRQKVVVANKILFTDSLKVEVRSIEIDTTKQGLFDIKPLTKVDKGPGNWWKYLLISFLILVTIGLLLYWFIWRKKPLSEEEEIALLPPYDRAKLALKKLEESGYLENKALKDYYSELTLIIRKYLDEKVYDHSLESTTDELIDRLNLLKEGNQIDFKGETINNLQSILKRADLVKFAKAAPDKELAQLDKQTIESEIDHVKEILPEPSEEEKLLDKKYREELERKQKRKKIITTAIISVAIILAILGAFSIKYGFNYVKDTIIGHDSKQLLESKDWITSDYGAPSLTITTPKVLKRVTVELPDDMKQAFLENQMFVYGSLMSNFYIAVNSLYINPEVEFDLNRAVEGVMVQFESQGAQNIITRQDEILTPNGSEGININGTMILVNPLTKKEMDSKYSILNFYNNGAYQQVQLIYDRNDEYAEKIVQRIINSIELIKPQV
ncbi:MAG: hypothetical protein HKO81_02625 [Flavobacteriaceae bacterium]|nr:hypothetical protein [Bacteroidia bacterium]NNL15519.1 hypothetical protein [Flavobacteriaceae bacterium]